MEFIAKISNKLSMSMMQASDKEYPEAKVCKMEALEVLFLCPTCKKEKKVYDSKTVLFGGINSKNWMCTGCRYLFCDECLIGKLMIQDDCPCCGTFWRKEDCRRKRPNPLNSFRFGETPSPIRKRAASEEDDLTEV